jgi:ATP-dependent Clp protease ATP-binding subunit ClpC
LRDILYAIALKNTSRREDAVMFEKYTEPARRVIFFARYEASKFGRGSIEPEHLLLGLMREGVKRLPELLDGEPPWTEWFDRLREKLGPADRPISTSVDMPLSEGSKRVLDFAQQECDAIGGGLLDVEHLLLGLLRKEASYPAELLRQRGADAAKIREKLKGGGSDQG